MPGLVDCAQIGLDLKNLSGKMGLASLPLSASLPVERVQRALRDRDPEVLYGDVGLIS